MAPIPILSRVGSDFGFGRKKQGGVPAGPAGTFTVSGSPYSVPGSGPWNVAAGAYDSGLTAGPQTLTVGAGSPFYVTFKVVGAGGGKGGQGSQHGGGGAGVIGQVELKAGQTYILVVGDGSQVAYPTRPSPQPTPYGGGGQADYPNRGGGGGFSGVFYSSVSEANAVIVAGGGGGHGSYGGGSAGGGTPGTQPQPSAGAPGAGPNADQSAPVGGGGTTNNSGLGPGGSGGSGQSFDGYPGPGISLQGGSGRGGGGGGYYGGGSGTDRGAHSPGGGGGSSYWGGHPQAPVSNTEMWGGIVGWYPSVPLQGYAAYNMPSTGGPIGNAGFGAGPNFTGTPYTNNGYPGRILIYRTGSEP